VLYTLPAHGSFAAAGQPDAPALQVVKTIGMSVDGWQTCHRYVMKRVHMKMSKKSGHYPPVRRTIGCGVLALNRWRVECDGGGAFYPSFHNTMLMVPHTLTQTPAPQVMNELRTHTYMLSMKQCRALGIVPLVGLFSEGEQPVAAGSVSDSVCAWLLGIFHLTRAAASIAAALTLLSCLG